MNIQSFAAISVLALSTCAINAQASQTWTVTTQGQITSGLDTTGVFGSIGQNLAGLSYTQSITASIDPAQWQNSYNNGWLTYMAGSGPAFTDTITVNGHTVNFILSTIGGAQLLANGASQGNVNYPNSYDEVYTDQYGHTASGGFFEGGQFAFSSTTAFVPTLNFGQKISQDTSDPSFSAQAFVYISGKETANFQANANTLTVTAVPEPETYAMLLAGLGLLGFVARRKA